MSHARSLHTEWITQVEAWPETGRRHQIRAHLCGLGHPILGDERYAIGPVLRSQGLFLFAAEIALAHPVGGQPLRFEAPLPGSLVRSWRGSSGAGRRGGGFGCGAWISLHGVAFEDSELSGGALRAAPPDRAIDGGASGVIGLGARVGRVDGAGGRPVAWGPGRVAEGIQHPEHQSAATSGLCGYWIGASPHRGVVGTPSMTTWPQPSQAVAPS